MKPAPFEYAAPETLAETLALLAQHGFDAKLLAGGQSLIPVMNFRLTQPTFVIDLNRVAGLDGLGRLAAGGLQIGAMVRQSRLERNDLVQNESPLIAEAIPYVAHPQIRNRGTFGGSVAHADPAGEIPVLTVALKARFHLQSVDSGRWVAATDFYQALFETALEPHELLTEIEIPPLPAHTGCAFAELARRHGDYAQAGVAALIETDAQGVCRAARLVFLNVGEIPMVATQAADMLVGETLSDTLIQEAATHAAEQEISPSTDIHATAAYKRHLARVLAQQTIKEATSRSQESWQS